jgi:hypothetical protein
VHSLDVATRVAHTVGAHGFENWILILGVGHRLRVFGNMVLRKIFGPKGKK